MISSGKRKLSSFWTYLLEESGPIGGPTLSKPNASPSSPIIRAWSVFLATVDGSLNQRLCRFAHWIYARANASLAYSRVSEFIFWIFSESDRSCIEKESSNCHHSWRTCKAISICLKRASKPSLSVRDRIAKLFFNHYKRARAAPYLPAWTENPSVFEKLGHETPCSGKVNHAPCSSRY